MSNSAVEAPKMLEEYRSEIDRHIQGKTLKLPVLPQVASQVLSITDDPNADLGALSDLIHKDPALAGHVLRIANSAAYAGSEPVVSLQQAITRLGMRLIGEIAMVITMKGEVFKAPGFESEITALWRHALVAATYSKEVARISRKNVEGQFLCGLLHTVGKPILLQLVAQLEKESGKNLEIDLIRYLLDEFHCQVIDAVAEKWNLPQLVQVCCGSYPRYKEVSSFKDETTMTYLSNRLATWVEFPDKLSLEELKQDEAFIELNFYPDDVQLLLEKKEKVQEIASQLSG